MGRVGRSFDMVSQVTPGEQMTTKASTREAAGRALVQLGGEIPDLVVLGGDLNNSTFAKLFGAAYPERFFDFGPAEQNIVSVAAGLASSGKIPVVSTFAVFATSRPYDQLRVGVSQPGLNVKVIVSHSGITTGEDGISAQSIEDLALMCALSTFTVLVPADAPETVEAVRAAVKTQGPFYVRTSRADTPVVHQNGPSFQIGRAEMMRDGADTTVVACGIMVHAALEAADNLAKRGTSCRVLNMSTIKPLDEEAVVRAARETGAIVTAEEHGLVGGLGSLVAQVLARELPTPVESIGLEGYAESGPADALLDKYHLRPLDVEKAVEKAVRRKAL